MPGGSLGDIGGRAERLVAALASTDFSSRPAVWWLSVAFLLVRLPWLWTGYGAETDAYRVALSALHLWRSGEYLPSRLPGYPVHELLMAPLVRFGGSVATNGATALIALLGVLLLARLVRELGEPSPGFVVLGMAFTPFLIANSVETKDYMWALSAMLGAYLALVRSRPILGGVLLGIAAGCRITSLLFGAPLILLLIHRRAWREAVEFALTSAATTFAVFLPVTLQYGTHFFAYADSRISADIVIRSIGQYSIGAVGALATLVALALSWRRVLGLVSLATKDIHVRIWLIAVGLYLLAFLRLPIDIAYLLPIYPFGFLLLGRILRRWMFAAVLVVIACSGLIDLDLSAMHNLNLGTFARTARPCRSCAELFHDWHVRALYVNYARSVPLQAPPPHTVVLTGAVFPVFAVLNWNRFEYSVVDRDRASISMLSDDGMMRDDGRDVVYLASPDRPAVLDGFRAQGYALLKSDPVGVNWDAGFTPVP
jgi:hypothetical protein